MQQINGPRTPAWRDPARLRREARSRRLRPILLFLSSLVLLFLVLPPEGAYDEAISLQLSRGVWSAWALFVTMGGTLAYVAVRLWDWENRVWSIAAALIVLGLGVIALTDPFSRTHTAVFIAMSLLIVLGHVGFFYGHLDFRLLPPTVLAVVAIFVCPTHLGIGERLLVASTIASLNVLIYGHLDP